MVHLGVGPGSQAYHLYDPEWRKLSISRDVVFDKNKKKWSLRLNKNENGHAVNSSEYCRIIDNIRYLTPDLAYSVGIDIWKIPRNSSSRGQTPIQNVNR